MSPTTSTPISDEFLGLRFDRLGMAATLAVLAESPESGFGYLVTPNVDHLVRLADARDRGDAATVAAYDGATLTLCDSRVLALLARARGVELPLVPGSDLTPRVIDELLRPGDAITLIGADAATAAALGARCPGIDVRQHVPPMGLRHDAQAIAEAARFVAASGGRFHFLAVGSPQQELLAQAIAARGDAQGWALCIGASIDFITGRQRRAPRWLQRLHLEWAHRLLSDPRRMWRRYLIEGPRILGLVARWRPDPRH